jgi:hypothetical protein
MPTRKTYRRITNQDNSTTLPNRVTFPVGTYTQVPQSNPSTAVDGALSGGNGMLPQRNIYGGTGPNYNDYGNIPPANQGGMNARQQNTGIRTPSNAFNIPSIDEISKRFPSVGQQTPLSTPGSPAFPSTRRPGGGLAPAKLSTFVARNQLPSSLNTADIKYWQNEGWDLGKLVQDGFFSYNPATGKFNITQLGMQANSENTQNAPAQGGASPSSLKYGEYIDNNGNVKRGTTRFGVNAQGQRLDANGNVFDNKTAKTDIYGGQFIQEGEVRWERNDKGKLVKVQYMSGNRKREVNKGKAKRRRQQQEAKTAANSVSNSGASVSNAFLNVQVG